MKDNEQRKYWLDTMLLIGKPVLEALAERKLKQAMPNEFHSDRSAFAHLEAFARLACGMAPWLELEGLEGDEEQLRAHYAGLMLAAIAAAVDPQSPDYMEFRTEGQPLVDAAFLAHALVRAPKALAGRLSGEVKANLITALKQTRRTAPSGSNWLLFSAMVEAALYLLGDHDYDRMRVGYAVHMFMDWYKGDGVYGDGKDFHWDYYNSFVIQPMLIDVVALFAQESEQYAALKPLIMERAQRYASVLERSIAPDGTYPFLGRSIVYRFGAFQLLSQAALQHFLEDSLPPAQVRCGLTAVIGRIMSFPGTMDDAGWLRPGVYGYQPELAESYINTGSLYLCAAVFLPLGLLPSDPFWAGEDAKWTSLRIVSGENVLRDHALE
ncbi:DUF2264 domain-containing protein [Paenibacillus sp. MMS20-IR301]|uniref:DUF2264 domain-containing protein n=1 Tax=Paenibacillus sp. MMS20-IR301 TaxID=2895946 RepID=UPI0028E47E61|nr:DUF2264 domain-containing protein [Paenibacillus sp. MMS20-IR301]WNS44137.1 DUF2264 domain-containing protein [Paenibacillus sp. MMS20-IR301]